jgi:hypothetical protein
MVKLKTGEYIDGEYIEYKEVIKKTILKYGKKYKHVLDDVIHDVMILIDPEKLTKDKTINKRIISAFTKRYLYNPNNYYKYIDNNLIYIPTFDLDFDENDFEEYIPQYNILKHYYIEMYEEIPDDIFEDENEIPDNKVHEKSREELIQKILNFSPEKYVSPKTLNIIKQLYIIYILNIEQLKRVKIKNMKYPKNMFILDLFVQLYEEGKLKELYNSLEEEYKIVSYKEIEKLITKNIEIYNEYLNNKRKTMWDGNTYRSMSYLTTFIDYIGGDNE